MMTNALVRIKQTIVTNCSSRSTTSSFFLIDYIIEAEPLVNRFISIPKDKGNKHQHQLMELS